MLVEHPEKEEFIKFPVFRVSNAEQYINLSFLLANASTQLSAGGIYVNVLYQRGLLLQPGRLLD